MIRVVLIGCGNVGWHIGVQLWSCANTPVEVFSRSADRAHALAGKISTRYTTDLAAITPDADIYVLAVPDDAIPVVSQALAAFVNDGAIIAHTSGSVSSNALIAHTRHGVFYPLQTFTAGTPTDWKTIPLLLTGNTDDVLAELEQLGTIMQCASQIISDQQRAVVHLAATISCNFTNHMYVIAHDLLQAHDLKFALLQPLIGETARKVQELAPRAAQTGPAIRGDQETLRKHMALLQGKPQTAILYALISRSIGDTQNR